MRIYNLTDLHSSKIVSVDLIDYKSYHDFLLEFNEYDRTSIKIDPSEDYQGMLLGFPDISKMISNLNNLSRTPSHIAKVGQIIGSSSLYEIEEFIRSNTKDQYDSLSDFLQSYLKVTPRNPYGYWVEHCEKMYFEVDNIYYRR